MWKCIVRLDCSKEKGKRKELGKNSFGNVWKPQFQMNECFAWKWEVFLTLISSDFMWICAIFMNMYLKSIVVKFHLWLNFSRNWSPLRDEICVCLVTRKHAWYNKVSQPVYCYIYLYTDSYVFMAVWCRDCMEKRVPWNLEEGSRWISLGGIGKPWGLSHGVCF